MEFWDWSCHGPYSTLIPEHVIEAKGHVDEGVEAASVILAGLLCGYLCVESLSISEV